MSVENKKTYLKGVSDKKNTCKIQVESEKKKEKRKRGCLPPSDSITALEFLRRF